MTYLLDTNAISEWVRPQPDPGIVQWLEDVDEDRTYLSVITLGELRRAVDRLTQSKRRDRLERWLTSELPDRFGERLLPVDAAVADEWGRLLAHSPRLLGRGPGTGRVAECVNALIAATAKVHGLQIVTRNVSHFQDAGVRVISPWAT